MKPQAEFLWACIQVAMRLVAGTGSAEVSQLPGACVARFFVMGRSGLMRRFPQGSRRRLPHLHFTFHSEAHLALRIESRVSDGVWFGKAGDARAWTDNPLPTRSKECEESGTNSPGSLLQGRPGGRQQGVWCGDSLGAAP